MPSFKMLFLSSVALLLLCQSSYSQDNVYSQISLPNQVDLKTWGLERVWWNQANVVPRFSKLNHLSVDERRCYALSSLGDISAFDAETGKKLWTNQIGLPNQPNTPAISNHKYVIYTSGSFLYALDKRNGDLIFRVRLPRVPSSPIIMDEDNVYLTSFDGNVFALSLETMEDLYKKELLPQWSNNVIAWRYNTSAPVPTSAVAIGNKINFVSKNGTLYCVTASNRNLVFQMETDARYSAPLGQFQNYLFAATEDFKFYCLNTDNGKIEWEFTTANRVVDKPIVVGDQLFIMPATGGIYCLSAETGVQKWWQPRGSKFIAASRSKIYLKGRNSTLAVLDRKTGEYLGGTYFQPYNIVYSNPLTDRIFVAANTGLIVCIRELDAEFPTYHLRPENQPILPTFAGEGSPEENQDAQEKPKDDQLEEVDPDQ